MLDKKSSGPQLVLRPDSLAVPAEESTGIERLVRLGRARDFNTEQFSRRFAAAGRGQDWEELLQRLFEEWVCARVRREDAIRVWTEIQKLYGEMRKRLGAPLGLPTVLVHYFTTRTDLLRGPHLLSTRRWEQLRAGAITDPLTRLYNRRFLSETLTRQIKRASRSGDLVWVVMLDLQGFRKLNNTFGHLAGDRALIETADVIRASLRPGDIACRWGGDEFVVVLPQADLLGSLAVAERIRVKAATRGVRLREGLRLGVHYGVSSFPYEGKTLEQLLRAADERLYECRQQWCFDGGNKRQHPRFSAARLDLQLRSMAGGKTRIAKVADVSYSGVAFELRADIDWPRSAIAEIMHSRSEGRPVRIRIKHKEQLADGRIRIGAQYEAAA